MATVIDVLRHLVAHVPGLGPENRAEATEAVDDFGAKLVDAGVYDHDQVFPPAPAPAPAAAGEDKDARIARLQAQLAEMRNPSVEAAAAGEAPAEPG